MVIRVAANGLAHREYKTPLGHPQDFKLPAANPFARTIEKLKPGATGSDIAELLDGRVQKMVACNWRSGRRPPAQWAIDRLHDIAERHIAELRADLAQMKAGAGRKAGTRNIMAYNARR